MGLLSFVKEAGAKLSGAPHSVTSSTSEDLKAGILRDLINGMNFDVTNLLITVSGTTAVVTGVAADQATREKIVLTIGNVNGITEVDDNLVVTTQTDAAQFYTVVKGDSLSKIAKELYGNAMKYPVIFEANKPMLSDPDLIYPGQVLRIPALEA